MSNKYIFDPLMRDAFFSWLVKVVPIGQLAYICNGADALEEYCHKKNLIPSYLFTISDKSIIERIQVRIAGDRLKGVYDRKRFECFLKVLRYYIDYISVTDLQKVQTETHLLTNTTISRTKETPEIQTKSVGVVRDVTRVETPVIADYSKNNPLVEHFYSYLNRNWKKASETHLLIDALTTVERFISKSPDYETNLTCVDNPADAGTILNQLLTDNAFRRLDRKRGGYCSLAAQQFVLMLKKCMQQKKSNGQVQ